MNNECKCLHCAFIDAPYLCENHTCEEGLLLEDNNKMKMEKWDEIYGNKEGYSCGYGGEPLWFWQNVRRIL